MKIVNLEIHKDGGTREYITQDGVHYCQDFRLSDIDKSDKVSAYPSVGQFFFGYPRKDGTNIITDLDLIQDIRRAILIYEQDI